MSAAPFPRAIGGIPHDLPLPTTAWLQESTS